MLREFGDEVQRIKDLEVVGNAAEEVAAGGLGEASAGFLLGPGDHLALGGEADEAGRLTGQEHVLGQTLAPGKVVGLEPHRGVHQYSSRTCAASHSSRYFS
jgi:hypothetical protein